MNVEAKNTHRASGGALLHGDGGAHMQIPTPTSRVSARPDLGTEAVKLLCAASLQVPWVSTSERRF